MAAVILFTDLLPEVSWLSIAFVEAHFKTVKDMILRNQTHFPTARFLRIFKKYASQLVHEKLKRNEAPDAKSEQFERSHFPWILL